MAYRESRRRDQKTRPRRRRPAPKTGSLILADTQQQRLLERLRIADDHPVAFAELRASGIHFPATVVSELQLRGYAFEHVREQGRMVGVRLIDPEPTVAPAVVPRD